MNDYGHINYVVNPPYYRELRNFEWLEDYLALQEVRKEIEFLKSKISETISTQSPKEVVKSRFRESYEKYQQRRIEKLAKMLEGFQSHRDPFGNIEYRLTGRPSFKRLNVSLTWSEIEQAFDLMEFPDDTLTDDEKESRLSDLRKAIEDLTAQMKEYSPPGYFIIRAGEIDCDSRERFVQYWRDIQGKCNAPCTPQGFALETGSDAEKEAYKKLGLSKSINTGAYAPDPHPRTEYVNDKGRDFVPRG